MGFSLKNQEISIAAPETLNFSCGFKNNFYKLLAAPILPAKFPVMGKPKPAPTSLWPYPMVAAILLSIVADP